IVPGQFLADCAGLIVAYFQCNRPAKLLCRLLDEAENDLRPDRSAIQCAPRIELHFPGKFRDLLRSDVGQVGGDEIEWSFNRFEKIALMELHAICKTQALRVLLRE